MSSCAHSLFESGSQNGISWLKQGLRAALCPKKKGEFSEDWQELLELPKQKAHLLTSPQPPPSTLCEGARAATISCMLLLPFQENWKL